MPAVDRRRVVIEAALPLIAHHGEAVTIQQIAQAAGVATGTAFRVFGGKAALIDAAVEHVLDLTVVDERLAAADKRRGLEDRLEVAGDAIGRHLAGVLPVVSALDQGANADPQRRFAQSMEALIARVATVVAGAADASLLRHPPELVARVYVGLYLAEGYGRRRHADPAVFPLGPVTDMFLHGALAPGTVE